MVESQGKLCLAQRYPAPERRGRREGWEEAAADLMILGEWGNPRRGRRWGEILHLQGELFLLGLNFN